MNSHTIGELLERLGHLLRAEERRVAAEHGLQPVQLHALGLLGRANRHTDTPTAVAEYLGATKGTVSQTLQRLRDKGLIEPREDPADARRVHLRPTAAGRALLRRLSASPALESSLGGLTDPEGLQGQLTQLLRGLQRAQGGRTFGVCETCRHLRREGGDRLRCGLTGDRLRRAETALQCREHALPDPD